MRVCGGWYACAHAALPRRRNAGSAGVGIPVNRLKRRLQIAQKANRKSLSQVRITTGTAREQGNEQRKPFASLLFGSACQGKRAVAVQIRPAPTCMAPSGTRQSTKGRTSTISRQISTSNSQSCLPNGSSGPQDGQSDHTGIDERVENGRVYTAEGNSGDTCRQNSHPIGYYKILAYGVPAY